MPHDGSVLDGGHQAGTSQSASAVVGTLDPGDGRDPQVITTPPRPPV